MGNGIISGRYILETRLGKGGMGIVYKAKHKFLKSLHAIKVILPNLVDEDSTLLTRFNQEAVLAASIDHPNVIRVTDFGVEYEQMPFLVMEFIDGTPLSYYLVEDKPLPLEKSVELFRPIALGVAEAHRKGIVHRDLKPQNIMVQKGMPLEKAIKVLDFGLAKIKTTESIGSFVQAQTLSILGSPPYMSPEQWSDGDVDHRADIYGLGVIFYQMLAGRLPFDADSIPAVMYQHLTAPMPTFTSFGLTLSLEVEEVVRKSLEKEVNNRYNSVEEMLTDLENAVKPKNLADTEYYLPKNTKEAEIPRPTFGVGNTASLTDSQKNRLRSYFDSQTHTNFVEDTELAQEFLQAQDRIEQAKAKADKADRLVQELAEAQKQASEAQERAIQAKQKIEEDVRQRVETELEKRLAEQQAKQEAEAKRLADEAEARKKAEERAIYLAQAALEAQQLAEKERKNREKEAQQRELEESVRKKAEIAALELSQQVAEAKRQFEEAKKQAEYEAELRRIAEEKRLKIESELHTVAQSETERRKMVETEAQKLIQQQASQFEREVTAAQQRIEDARQLAEMEAQKREQAEAARLHAEEEAQKLAEEILRVQREMEEMKLHITSEASDKTVSMSDIHLSNQPPTVFYQSGQLNLGNQTQPVNAIESNPALHKQTGQYQTESGGTNNYSGFMDNSVIPERSLPIGKIIAGVVVLGLLVFGGIGAILYATGFFNPPIDNKNKGNSSTNNGTKQESGDSVKREFVLVEGGGFQMGKDIPKSEINDYMWGNQYPVHQVTVSSFLIAKTETTNAQYGEFVADTKRPAPTNWADGKFPANEGNFPVTFVSLEDAKAYAEWVSKKENKLCRLPSEEEWEFAARNGSQQTIYPWGNDWNPELANLTKGRVAEVSTSKDLTAKGEIFDMLGNVIEWTSNKYKLYAGHPGTISASDSSRSVARGSSWGVSQNQLKFPDRLTTYRHYIAPEEKSVYVGFRVVCQP